MSYSVSPAFPQPPEAPPPPKRRSSAPLLLAGVGVLLLVALSAGLGAAGGYALARRDTTVAPAPTALPEAVSIRQETALVDVVRRVKPAVVTVVSTMPQVARPQGFAPYMFGLPTQQDVKASGSGVIVDEQGHIVTNYHVIDGAAKIEVIFADGKKAPCTLVGGDQYNDLAVVKVDVPVPAFAALGDSTQLQEGEPVVAIGSPLGQFRGSVTSGIVSGLGRTLDVSPQLSLEGLIQTDAAINHGNSGGPLVNLAGQVIGINTAIVRADPATSATGRYGLAPVDVTEGIGFAIPSATVREISEQLIATGKVLHPYLGVRYQEITPAMAAAYSLPVRSGLFVQDIERNSPAADANIQRGDIIVQIDDTPLDQDHSLISILLKRKVGDEITLTYYRNGQILTTKTKLTAR
ncbi:MAG: trypsin-like peptidase domain-containing protein [Anaerolineae bacterium]